MHPLPFYVSDEQTTISSTTDTPIIILVTNVRITEGDDLILNCTTEIHIYEWSRKEGEPDISESRTLKVGASNPISSSATVKDSGKYLCEIDGKRYIFNVSVEGREIRNQHDSFNYLGLWIVICTYTRCLTKKNIKFML